MHRHQRKWKGYHSNNQPESAYKPRPCGTDLTTRLHKAMVSTKNQMKNAIAAVVLSIAFLTGCTGADQKTETKPSKPVIKILVALTEEDGAPGTWKTCTGISGMGLVLNTNISIRDENGKLVGTSSWKNISQDGIKAVAKHIGITPEQTREWLAKNQSSLCFLEADAEINGQPDALEINMLGEKYSVTRAELKKEDWTLTLGKGDYSLLMKMNADVKRTVSDKR